MVSGIRRVLSDSWYSQNRIVGKKDRAKIGENNLQNRRKFQFPPKSQKFSGEIVCKIGDFFPKSELENYPEYVRKLCDISGIRHFLAGYPKQLSGIRKILSAHNSIIEGCQTHLTITTGVGESCHLNERFTNLPRSDYQKSVDRLVWSRGKAALNLIAVGVASLFPQFLDHAPQANEVSRPVTSLSNSRLPTGSLDRFVSKWPCSSKQPGDVKRRRSRRNSGVGSVTVVAVSPWGRARRDLSVASSVGLFGRMCDGGME